MKNIDNVTVENFGKRLMDLRLYKKLSQDDLAKVLGISRSGYWKIEHGQNKTLPSMEQIIAIENKLEVAPGTLLGSNDHILERYTEEEQELLKEEHSADFVKLALAKYKEYKRTHLGA